jgi:hypothetical protein
VAALHQGLRISQDTHIAFVERICQHADFHMALFTWLQR